MKLTFRTVSGTTFNLDAEAETTIGEVKQSVVAVRSLTLESLKLVYK